MTGIEVSMFISPYDPVAKAETRPNRPEPTTSPTSTEMISFDTNRNEKSTKSRLFELIHLLFRSF